MTQSINKIKNVVCIKKRQLNITTITLELLNISQSKIIFFNWHIICFNDLTKEIIMVKNEIKIKLFNDLQIKVYENRCEGAFNKVCWADCEKIASLIQISLEELFPEAEVFTPIYQNKLSNEELELGIDIWIEYIDLAPALLNNITFYILNSIQNESLDQDLFRDFELIDQSIKDVLQPIIINFIEKNKGKRIIQPIEIKVADEKFVVTGQYKKTFSDVVYLEPISIKGKIDGLIKSKTKINIIDKNTTIVAYYDFERFFYELHKILGSNQQINFILQPITNKNNKTDYIVSEFHPSVDTYDENELNFNEKI